MTEPIRVVPLAPAHLAAVKAFFADVPSACFCRYWHFEGNKNAWLDRCAHAPDDNYAELSSGVIAGDPASRALVAFRDERMVGWMKLTARSMVPKLRGQSVYRALDLGPEDTTFAIGCLLVHPADRKSGVARALVAESPRWAATWGGRAVEAYPRRSTDPLYDEEIWQGPEALFRDLGFTPVHDVGPYPVYRLILT
jgi:GNAT superfamily N-acetyltransferase